MDLWVECQCPGVNVPISTDNKASGRMGEASDQLELCWEVEPAVQPLTAFKPGDKGGERQREGLQLIAIVSTHQVS